MIISKSTAYGIRALSYLASHPDRVCGLPEIASQLEIPSVYLGKILGELRRHRLIVSVRGIHGGYRLDVPPQSISFWDLFNILEPNPYVDQCILARGACEPSNGCEAHEDWQALRNEIIEFLRRKKISNAAYAIPVKSLESRQSAAAGVLHQLGEE